MHPWTGFCLQGVKMCVFLSPGVSLGGNRCLEDTRGHPNSFLICGESTVSREERWSSEFARVCQFNRLNYIKIFPVYAPICSFKTAIFFLSFSFFLFLSFWHLCVPLH